MAYTESDLVANITTLETALLREERTVQFADRSVTYESKEAIASAIAYFKGLLVQLQQQAGTASRSRQTYAVSSKGF